MLDLSKVPDLEQRQKLLEVIRKIEEVRSEREVAARDARNACEEESDRINNERAARMAPFYKAILEAEAPFDAQLKALGEEAENLGAPGAAMNAASYDFNLCAVSGLPIFEGDPVWEHELDFSCQALQYLFPPIVMPEVLPVDENDGEDDEIEEAA